MSSLPVIAIIDIGKTNKKIFLYDRDYHIVWEQTIHLPEVQDEDGDPVEDIHALTHWVATSLHTVMENKAFDIKAIHCCTYGASFVLLDEANKPVAPLYNYLKAYPQAISDAFYAANGGRDEFSLITASPALGSLNSGLQLYRIMKENPARWNAIKTALHLPQYISFLITGRLFSDITSIGCHTGLWNFRTQQYHDWVIREGVNEKLAPIYPSDRVLQVCRGDMHFVAGVGLHDSSAALIPYLRYDKQPFVLLSTGTWCIGLHPFNSTPLTIEELNQDCLAYLDYKGRPVKASRLFAGYVHEKELQKIATHFNRDVDFYKEISFDAAFNAACRERFGKRPEKREVNEIVFGRRNLGDFAHAEEAYQVLMMDIMLEQQASLQRLLKGSPANTIYVDGGFAGNRLYMQMLALAFPEQDVYAATVSQASALGAALSIHDAWNGGPVPDHIVQLCKY